MLSMCFRVHSFVSTKFTAFRKVSNVTGASSCTVCPPGTFSGLAYTECSPCPLGSVFFFSFSAKQFQYTNTSGTENACHLCPLSQYTDNVGRSECKYCPYGTTTIYLGATSILDCECLEGYTTLNTSQGIVLSWLSDSNW